MTIARFALMPDIVSLRDAMDRLAPVSVPVERELTFAFGSGFLERRCRSISSTNTD